MVAVPAIFGGLCESGFKTIEIADGTRITPDSRMDRAARL
jgi:hypothetical protein